VFLLAALPQHPWNMSALSMSSTTVQSNGPLPQPQPGPGKYLKQLSALTSLQELKLSGLPPEGVPGGVTSQLGNLTCLHIQHDSSSNANHFQHLSRLTALQDLAVQGSDESAGRLHGIERLTQLTSLRLASPALTFSSTGPWRQLTGLQQLVLVGCIVQPHALEGFTQLRALSMETVAGLQPATMEQLLGAVARLTLLTQLTLSCHVAWEAQQAADPAATFTALTASSHLCSLQLAMHGSGGPQTLVLFNPETVLPQLHLINLQYSQRRLGALPLDGQQLQQLCCCCPAVQDLEFVLDPVASSAACLPLQQLSMLTRLKNCLRGRLVR
jgi:hypothetical protein